MADMLRGRRPSADSVLTKDSYGMGVWRRRRRRRWRKPQGYSAAAAAGKLPQSSQSQQLAASYSSSGKASGSGRSQGSGGGGTGPRSPGGGTAVFGGHTSDDHKSVSSGGSGGHSGDHEGDPAPAAAAAKLGKVLTWGKSKSAGPGSAGATSSGASIIHVGGGSPGSIISGIGKKPVETEQEREARMKREAKMIKERAYAVFM
ncbi:hypothetical protein DFJ73DRAFT_799667 [Zopfochytrium polystomum]|nr:hypothetical protein DFJ73DRAFT_799667 [Zopfochytrium polystomum]